MGSRTLDVLALTLGAAIVTGCAGSVTAGEYCQALEQCGIGLGADCACSFGAARRYAESLSCEGEFDDVSACLVDAYGDAEWCKEWSGEIPPEPPCTEEDDALYECTKSGSGYTVDCSEGADVTECPDCSKPTVAGALPIEGATGLVASTEHAGVLYAISDQAPPRFFAVGAMGEALDSFGVAGVTDVDWADVARGPCAGGTGSCLYLADIGDPDETRATYVIHRVAEPSSVTTSSSMVLDAEQLSFEYPDGSHDATTLLVHPKTGGITIVTLGESPGQIYASTSALEDGSVTKLVHMGSVNAPYSKHYRDGDLDLAATGALLLTSGHVWLFAMSPEEDVAEVLQTRPCEAPGPAPLGFVHGIAWRSDAATYLLFGESGSFEPELNEATCSP